MILRRKRKHGYEKNGDEKHSYSKHERPKIDHVRKKVGDDIGQITDKNVYSVMMKIALRDPFIQLIVGFVAIAVVANFVASKMQNGMNAVFGISLAVTGGVVLFILRTLMKYANSAFVKMLCYVSAGVIMTVFLIFVVLLVPAATYCVPRPYAELLNLPRCPPMVERPFEARVPEALRNVVSNPDNKKYNILVFYRLNRQEDAELIVGGLQKAGYESSAAVSSLNEVVAPSKDKQPGNSLIKTTASARPVVGDVSDFVRKAIPPRAGYVSVFPGDSPLSRGAIQISLF
jgi:hypothetical protein